MTTTHRWSRILHIIIYSLINIIYRNTNSVHGCLKQLVLSMLLHLRRTQNSLPVEVHATAWWQENADRLFVGDDQKVQMWDLTRRQIHQVIGDDLERWGQITCVHWLTTFSDYGDTLCFGTGRGLVLIYQWMKEAVCGYAKWISGSSTYHETGPVQRAF